MQWLRYYRSFISLAHMLYHYVNTHYTAEHFCYNAMAKKKEQNASASTPALMEKLALSSELSRLLNLRAKSGQHLNKPLRLVIL